MTYDQLVNFEAVINQGSFKAASEYLNKTQPSISISIKKLEDEFGIQLFSRDDYRPKLTEQGKVFYQKSLQALNSFKELETFAKELKTGTESEINIYIDAIFPINLIAKQLPALNCSINYYVDLLDGLMDNVLNRKADIALGTYLESNTNEIEIKKLFDVKLIPVIASSKYDEFAKSFDYLKTFSQIIVRSSSQNFDQKIQGHNKLMKKAFTSDMDTKFKLICNGLGWGRLPEHMIDDKIKNKSLKIITEINEVYEHVVPLFLMRHKKHILGINGKKLWENMSKIEFGGN